MKKILLLIVICFSAWSAFAQNFTYGQVTHDEMDFDRKKSTAMQMQ